MNPQDIFPGDIPLSQIHGADEKEGVLLTELDLDYEEQVREELPLLKSRRKDMYRLEKLCK